MGETTFAERTRLKEAMVTGYDTWTLPKGEYVICTFEAENFDALVMDA